YWVSVRYRISFRDRKRLTVLPVAIRPTDCRRRTKMIPILPSVKSKGSAEIPVTLGESGDCTKFRSTIRLLALYLEGDKEEELVTIAIEISARKDHWPADLTAWILKTGL